MQREGHRCACVCRHRARWSTLSLLLQRGSDPNASRLPMPVLFLAIKAAHVEAVRALLQRGAQTDRPLPAEVRTRPSEVRTHPSEVRTRPSVGRTHPSEVRTHPSPLR